MNQVGTFSFSFVYGVRVFAWRFTYFFFSFPFSIGGFRRSIIMEKDVLLRCTKGIIEEGYPELLRLLCAVNGWFA